MFKSVDLPAPLLPDITNIPFDLSSRFLIFNSNPLSKLFLKL